MLGKDALFSFHTAELGEGWLVWGGKENEEGEKQTRGDCVSVYTTEFSLEPQAGVSCPSLASPFFTLVEFVPAKMLEGAVTLPKIICSCVPFPECLLGTRCQASRCKVTASYSLFRLGSGLGDTLVVSCTFSPPLP